MKYLLDTNVLRELGKTSPHKNVAAWLKSVDDADLAISALTAREIAKGIAKLRKTKPETAAALGAAVSAIFDAFEGRIPPINRPVTADRHDLSPLRLERPPDRDPQPRHAQARSLLPVAPRQPPVRARLERALAFTAASSKTDQTAIARIVAEQGRDGFAAAWLRAKGLDWAADMMITRSQETSR
jgi:hypothetical protein